MAHTKPRVKTEKRRPARSPNEALRERSWCHQRRKNGIPAYILGDGVRNQDFKVAEKKEGLEKNNTRGNGHKSRVSQPGMCLGGRGNLGRKKVTLRKWARMRQEVKPERTPSLSYRQGGTKNVQAVSVVEFWAAKLTAERKGWISKKKEDDRRKKEL